MADKDLIPQVLDGTLSDEGSPSLGQFEFWLKDLANCASWLVNIIALDHTGIDVLAADDSEAFHLKLKCNHAARDRVARAVVEAEDKMSAHTYAPESGSFYHDFKRDFDTRLDALRGQLEALRTPENSTIVDEIEHYLTASTIHSKAKEINDSLAGVYHLRSMDDYYASICYDVYDPSDYETGFAKLIAKGFTRYGFNCFEAIRAIEEDAQAVLNRFQEDFNTQIQEEILVGIVEPIQAVLPQLRAKTAPLSA